MLALSWHDFSLETQVRCVRSISSPYLFVNLALLANKSVLELGSGTGFLGLIVADIQVGHSGTTGSSVLHLTDVNEDVLRRCHEIWSYRAVGFSPIPLQAPLTFTRRIFPSRESVRQVSRLVRCTRRGPCPRSRRIYGQCWPRFDTWCRHCERSCTHSSAPSHTLPRSQLYHPDMIAPFLTTLNIALQASKVPSDGIAYLALTVRNVDLLNTFIFALGRR